MFVLAVDITQHLQLLFDFVNKIYLFLNSLEISAFGFTFTLLGIFLSLSFLIVLVKFLKFGFEDGPSSSIKYSRVENNHTSERVKNAKLGTEKSQRRNGTFISKWI